MHQLHPASDKPSPLYLTVAATNCGQLFPAMLCELSMIANFYLPFVDSCLATSVYSLTESMQVKIENKRPAPINQSEYE